MLVRGVPHSCSLTLHCSPAASAAVLCVTWLNRTHTTA
jgi:hypothetical protein